MRRNARALVAIDRRVFLLALAAASALARAGYEAPNPAYSPPASYYAAATGTGSALRMNLHNIIANMTSISYGDARYAIDDIYADPVHPGNVLLAYSRASVSGSWEGGTTWNREHLWPQSKLGVSVDYSYRGPGSDLFELRPADSSTNSSRGNKAYGSAATTGGYSTTSNSFRRNRGVV